MEIRRVDPKKQLVKHIKEIDDRVKGVENRPSGEVVIRETLTATDPVTGVSTILGQLSDGTVGLKQWVGDLIAPEQPSNPATLENLGVVSIEWNGKTLSGGPQPPDYKKTVVEIAPSTTGPWTEVDTLYGRGVATLIGLETGVIKYFRLISLDQNDNRSDASIIVSATPTAIADDPDLVAVIQASSNGRNVIRYQSTQPTGTGHTVGDTWFKRTSISAPITGQYTWDGDSWEEQKLNHQVIASVDLGTATVGLLDGIYIKGRTIDANLLVADLVLSTRIIAGNPSGTHAEMKATGFHVFAFDANDGIPNEVIRLGVEDTNDYFAIIRDDGFAAATISQDGVGSFSSVYANESLFYKGTELETIINRRSPIVNSAYRTTNAVVNAYAGGPYFPYLRLEATLEANKVYRISTSSIRVDTDPNTTATVAIGYAPAGQLATSSNVSLLTLGHSGLGTSRATVTLNELWSFSGFLGEERMISFIILQGVTQGVGGAGIRADFSNPVRLIVEDMGYPQAGSNGAWLDGTTPPPPARQTYVKQWGCINSMNYAGNNSQYNYNTGQMYQGLSPAGYGNTKSIAIFNNMIPDLSGATINYARVFLKFNHWYYNAGGTARIGLHAHTGIPGSFTGNLGIAVASGGWPKPGARWVDFPPSVIDGFRTGQYRGIYLEGDGTYGTYGLADRPTIEIGYTK